MNIILILIIVTIGSILTFFSGFGLGTILLPIFLLFFPLKIAIFSTAIVHFSNSIFKFIYIYKHIKFNILLIFGIPAIIASIIGSYLISEMSETWILFSYSIDLKEIEVFGSKFFIGLLIFVFTIFELLNKTLFKIQSTKNELIIGGLLSGFFGGISGHQGALRTLFLKKVNLSKEELVATSTTISLGIDFVRIVIYLQIVSLPILFENENKHLIFIGIIAAFLGATIGSKLLKKVTMKFVQTIISVLLIVFSMVLMLGWI
jgi:uncharacterized membrane protein YfcA